MNNAPRPPLVDPPTTPINDSHPTFSRAFLFWLKLGFISFGGPTGQIAIMHTELVERKRWISEGRFLHALNYCMLLPGPEAQQLAIYIGWLLHRTWGGIVAGSLFVLPSVFLLWLLSYIYAEHGNVPWIASIFYGLKPAVVAIVAFAVIRIGKKALKNEIMWTLAAAAFVAIYFFHVPFPIIILVAGLIGLIGGRVWPKKFIVLKPHGGSTSSPDKTEFVLDDAHLTPHHARPSLFRAIQVIAICAGLWWLPILLLAQWRGGGDTLVKEGIFFSKAAMVTFGGAYAVLPYVAQQAVDRYGWLTAPQMLDGLGLAESTPGPLIMVVQFVGFMGGWNQPGDLPPLLAATLGAVVTTWCTFVPCFLWILLGAPYIERLRSHTWLTATLSAVTAAVVGVVLNLAVWFAIHALFPAGNIDPFALIIAIAAFLGMLSGRLNLIAAVIASGLLGLGYKMLS